MKQLTVWKAFDGSYFEDEQECINYETDHPFLDHKQIIFYSNNGKMIEEPDYLVLLDSNAFEVFSHRAFEMYSSFCRKTGIRIPKEVADLPFPHHYKFDNGRWICIEEEIALLDMILHESFGDEFVQHEEDKHDLIE